MNKNKVLLRIIIFLMLIIGVFKIQTPISRMIYRTDYSEYVYKYSEENNIDPYLVFAIIKAESNFNKEAVSKSGAIGLMQLMEETAKEVAQNKNLKNFTKEDLYIPEKNIMLGVTYFKELLRRYNNINVALVAYNAGIGVVDNWIKQKILDKDGNNIENIPYKETNMYVRKILRDYEIYSRLYKK